MTRESKKLPGNFALLTGIFLLAIAMAAHVYLISYYDFTQDDAYISFRYAQNHLDGHGLVYNIGDRVEGYTNFLWTLLMILGRQMGVSFVALSQALGSVFGLATTLLLFSMTRLLTRDISGIAGNILPGICCLILGTIYSFAYWAVAGLETTAFGFLLLLAIFSYIRRSVILIPSLVLATLLRPEGGLIFVFIILYEVISRRSWTRYLQAMVFIYIAFLLPFLVFKLYYYGSLLPNSFYAKTSFSLQQIVYGLDYVWLFIRHYLGYGVFFIPAILLFHRFPSAVRICMAFVVVYTLYIIFIGGDVLKVHRFFVPLFPLFILVMVYSSYTLLKRRHLYFIVFSVMIFCQLTLPRKHVTDFHQAEIGLATNMGTMMDNLLAADQTDFSLAVSTIGLVGYRLMGHTVIDLLGLTDATIARHPEPAIAGLETSWRESHHNSQYVLMRQPDYILFSTGFKPSAPAERALFLYSSFLKSYRTIGFFYSESFHSIFKRYLPVEGEIRRDVDVRFVQSFNRGINLLLTESKFQEALISFSDAEKYLNDSTYPYIYYWSSIAFARQRDFESPKILLSKIVSMDTLVYEGYLGLCTYACVDRDREKYEFYRAKLAKLTPWYIPRLDSMGNKVFNQ